MERVFVDNYGCHVWLFSFDEGTMEDGKNWTIFEDDLGINHRDYKTEAGALRWLAKHGYTEER